MAKFLMLAGTLIGMLLIASVLSLMFGLISAIQPRETLVSIVSSVGGTPPSGIAILETYSQMQGRDCLQSFFDECHRWCADVLETSCSAPVLWMDYSPPYFCSRGASLERFQLCFAAYVLPRSPNRCRRTTGSQVPCMRPNQDHATLYTGHRLVSDSGFLPDLSRECGLPPVSMSSFTFRYVICGSLAFVFLIHTKREVPRAFP